MSAEKALSSLQRDDLRVVAAMIIPASEQFGVPGADDAAIQADILATLGRDAELVREALDHLARLAGMPLANLGETVREAVAQAIPCIGRNCRGDGYPRRAAMLLSRRSRAAFPGAGTAATVSKGIWPGAGRLVAAGASEGASFDVASGTKRAP